MNSHNKAVKLAAAAADAEADRLDALAAEMRSAMARSPRRGQKWILDEYLAAARAVRRVAIDIRALKIKEKEG